MTRAVVWPMRVSGEKMDAYRARPGMLCVISGAGVYREHGVTAQQVFQFADAVAGAVDHLVDGPDDLDDRVAWAIERAQKTCGPWSVAVGLAVAAWDGDRIEALVLGDGEVVVIDNDRDAPRRIADPSWVQAREDALAPVRRCVEAGGDVGGAYGLSRVSLISHHARANRSDADLWLVRDSGDAATMVAHAHRDSIPMQGQDRVHASHVMVATRGAMDLADVFGATTIPEMVADAVNQNMIETARTAWRRAKNDPDRVQYVREELFADALLAVCPVS